MELHEYPRPESDTGIGVHWVAGYAAATGLARIRERWIPEMKALGVKWVKIFTHDGALDLAELLLSEGLMPIVRLYRPSPNPGRLGVKEIVHLDALIRAGVHYFEFNSEPDKDGEWKGGRLPSNALDLAAENAIADMETILERGGMPGVPALAGGSTWDLVGRMIALGRRDLFDGPVWQAIHNYPRNRPLDYPLDIGNQEGSAYTERFYRVVADEAWGEHAWRGRSLAEVNRLRAGRANPGATIGDDHDCWLAFKHYDALNRRHLGRSLPLLSTECGYLVGEDLDPRYPATTPDLHMAQTLEACRIMMGTSRRFEAAPDYYFCTAFWLLANRELGSSSNWWEGHAWYSDRWPNGALPIVRALRAESKSGRRWQQPSPAAIRVAVQGYVAHAAHDEVVLVERADGSEIARAAVDSRGHYALDALTPGAYQLRLQRGEAAQQVDLSAEQSRVIVNFEQKTRQPVHARSVVSGRVRGGAGAVVALLRQSDGEEWVTLAKEDGRFRFVDLAAGVYAARVHGQGSHAENLILDGRNEVDVQLATAGWGYTVQRLDAEPSAHTGAVVCVVEHHKGVAVYAEQGAWRSEPSYTGSAPQYGPHACVIAPLEAGDYWIVVDEAYAPEQSADSADERREASVDRGGDLLRLEARVHVDRKQLPVLTFVHNEADLAEIADLAAIRVAVEGVDPTAPVTAVLIDSQAQRTSATQVAGQPIVFGGLTEGLYAVEVMGDGQMVSRRDIAVDGLNEVAVQLHLANGRDADAPVTALSRVVGTAPDAAGRLAILADAAGHELSCVVDEEGAFSFPHLAPGHYTVRIEGGYVQEGIRLDGLNGVAIQFSPLVRSWYAEQSNAGTMPGFSTLCVEVEGRDDLPVHIWQEDGVSLVRRTGSADGLHEDVAEFRPLEAGRYLVEPDGLDVHAQVELTGLETVWISFRQRTEPARPNHVQPLDPPASEEMIWEAADDGDREGAHDVTQAVDAQLATGPAPIYIFLGNGVICTEELAPLLALAAARQPAYGADLDAACRAAQVLLIGDVDDDVRAKLAPHLISAAELYSSFPQGDGDA